MDTPPDSAVMKVSEAYKSMHDYRLKGSPTRPDFPISHPELQSRGMCSQMEKDGSPHRHHPEQPRRKKVPAADFSHRMAPSTCGLETHRDVCQNVKSNDDQGMAANRMVPSMLSYEAHRDLYHDTDRFDDDEISGRNLLPIRTGREIQQNLQCEAGINDQYTNSQNLATRLWENEAQ